MPETNQKCLEVASEAAASAGKFLMQNLGKLNPEDVEEKSRNSFVTYVDKQSEKLIIDRIKKHFPEHSIIAEEGSAARTKSDYLWLIDPLDGTTNFIRGLPHFSVSIAVQHGEEMVVGVVYNPDREEMFTAQIDQPACLNDKPIHVDERTDFGRSVLATGFPHQKKRYLPLYLPAFEEIMLKCSGIRRWGSAALDLCYTACGRYGGFWELGLSPWDIAAGSLIVRQAGGVVSDFWGRPGYLENGFIIAGGKHIWKQLQEILNFHFKTIHHEKSREAHQ